MTAADEPVRLHTVAEQERDERIETVARALEDAAKRTREEGHTRLMLCLCNEQSVFSTDWVGMHNDAAAALGMIEALKWDIISTRRLGDV